MEAGVLKVVRSMSKVVGYVVVGVGVYSDMRWVKSADRSRQARGWN